MMQVLGWSPKGPLAGLLGGTDASSVADGSFDAVLGGMLETPATGGGVGTFGGAGSGGAGSGGSGAVPSEAASSEAASLAAASGATSGRFVGLLQGVPGARHDGQRGIESELSGAGKSDHLDDSLSGRFVGSLRNVPGARHDRQRGIEMADGVASSTVRLDDSLSIRRLLPSSTQVPVETVSASSLESGGGVPVAGMTGVGRGQGGAGIAGSGTDAAEGTSGRFVGSLQGVPGARHDRQRGIEMADGVASSTVRLDGSLSIRRLLPSSAQEAVETGSSSSLVSGGGVPVAGMTGVGRGQGGAGIAGSGTDAAEGTS
ncbi:MULTISPECIES: hypothetical protein, partial [unclassified Paenarthrobacter]|uniref:hypothetical protein n=1 Tax=unclassified Paenarthrobacter TaxID=2634190 RepID=UPI0037F9C5A7